MPEAWKLADGNGVIVAVLDTGVAYEDYKKFHELPDLKGLTFVEPYDFVSNTTHANDDHGHGSHVTGTIAQATNNGIGVAGVALQRQDHAAQGAVGLGLGLGRRHRRRDPLRGRSTARRSSTCRSAARSRRRVLKKAVEYAHDKGVTVVCAAGNESRGKVGYPAAYPGAVAVSRDAVRRERSRSTRTTARTSTSRRRAATPASTRTATACPDGVLQNTIVIGDPTKDGYFAYMGTSMASPHVAGVAALVVGEGVTNPDQVEKILKDERAQAREPDVHRREVRRRHHRCAGRDPEGARARPAAASSASACCSPARSSRALDAPQRSSASATSPASCVGASGLFFLPYLAPSLSSVPVVHALTHGLPSWDLSLLGVGGHGNALFFSALAAARAARDRLRRAEAARPRSPASRSVSPRTSRSSRSVPMIDAALRAA